MARAKKAVIIEEAARILREHGIKFEIRDGDIYYVDGDAVKVAKLCREGKITMEFLCG